MGNDQNDDQSNNNDAEGVAEDKTKDSQSESMSGQKSEKVETGQVTEPSHNQPEAPGDEDCEEPPGNLEPDTLSDDRPQGEWSSRYCPCSQEVIYLEKRTLIRRGVLALLIIAAFFAMLLPCIFTIDAHPTAHNLRDLITVQNESSTRSPDSQKSVFVVPPHVNQVTLSDDSSRSVNQSRFSKNARSVVNMLGCIISAAAGGLLAGLAFSIKWLNHTVAKGTWNIDRHLWRLNTPFTSAILGAIVVIIIQSNIFNILSAESAQTWHASLAIGFLTGYFSDNAIAKMNELAMALFGTNPTSKEVEEGQRSIREASKKSGQVPKENQSTRNNQHSEYSPRCNACPHNPKVKVSDSYHPGALPIADTVFPSISLFFLVLRQKRLYSQFICAVRQIILGTDTKEQSPSKAKGAWASNWLKSLARYIFKRD